MVDGVGGGGGGSRHGAPCQTEKKCGLNVQVFAGPSRATRGLRLDAVGRSGRSDGEKTAFCYLCRYRHRGVTEHGGVL